MAVRGSLRDEEAGSGHGGRTRTIPRRGHEVDALLAPLEGGLGEGREIHSDLGRGDPKVPQRRWFPFQWFHPKRLLPLRHGQN